MNPSTPFPFPCRKILFQSLVSMCMYVCIYVHTYIFELVLILCTQVCTLQHLTVFMSEISPMIYCCNQNLFQPINSYKNARQFFSIHFFLSLFYFFIYCYYFFYLQDFQLLLSGGSADITISRLKSIITFNHTHGGSRSVCDRFEKYVCLLLIINILYLRSLPHFTSYLSMFNMFIFNTSHFL